MNEPELTALLTDFTLLKPNELRFYMKTIFRILLTKYLLVIC